ncbi:uncharacterized protein [Antedon mediterranea]|uniref:uncharacterized protein n=1 Tax=Antedon mediterranea TaxID=105859 RepID=UPI003AF6B20B
MNDELTESDEEVGANGEPKAKKTRLDSDFLDIEEDDEDEFLRGAAAITSDSFLQGLQGSNDFQISSPKQDTTVQQLLEGLTCLLEQSANGHSGGNSVDVGGQNKSSDVGCSHTELSDTLKDVLTRLTSLEKEVAMLKRACKVAPKTLTKKVILPPPTTESGIYKLGGEVPVCRKDFETCVNGADRATSLVRALMDMVFLKDELLSCNLSGTGVLKPLPETKMLAIFREVDVIFPNSTITEEKAIKEAVNGKCRYVRFLNKRREERPLNNNL